MEGGKRHGGREASWREGSVMEGGKRHGGREASWREGQRYFSPKCYMYMYYDEPLLATFMFELMVMVNSL